MLGDNPERSKNPLKKAMRRRNAKMVQFSAPTYYDPPDTAFLSDGFTTAEDSVQRFPPSALESGDGQQLEQIDHRGVQEPVTNGAAKESGKEMLRVAPIAQGAGDIMRTSFDDSRGSDEIALNEQGTYRQLQQKEKPVADAPSRRGESFTPRRDTELGFLLQGQYCRAEKSIIDTRSFERRLEAHEDGLRRVNGPACTQLQRRVTPIIERNYVASLP